MQAFHPAFKPYNRRKLTTLRKDIKRNIKVLTISKANECLEKPMQNEMAKQGNRTGQTISLMPTCLQWS